MYCFGGIVLICFVVKNRFDGKSFYLRRYICGITHRKSGNRNDKLGQMQYFRYLRSVICGSSQIAATQS